MEFSLEQINKAAEVVITAITTARSDEHAVLVTFSGSLGAGKTTLIQEIAKQLGVTETLQSPTYVIYKRYETSPLTPLLQGEGNRILIHGDMYRLESGEEMKKLGWDELLADSKNILLIEWPEKVADIIPEWAVQVKLTQKGETVRNIDIS